MNLLTEWQAALSSSWVEILTNVLVVIPKILGGVIVFSIGLILAFWAKRLIVSILRLVKFEEITKTVGLEEYLKKAEIKLSFSELLGTIVEWFVILVFFLAVVDILELKVVSQVVLSVLVYLPNLIAAVLIFAAGYMVAGLVDNLVRGALVSVDHEIARPLGKVARWIVILIALFTAIDQLQIAQGLIQVFFEGLTYTLVLIFGLSFGLGAKDLVSKILNDWYEKIKK